MRQRKTRRTDWESGELSGKFMKWNSWKGHKDRNRHKNRIKRVGKLGWLGSIMFVTLDLVMRYHNGHFSAQFSSFCTHNISHILSRRKLAWFLACRTPRQPLQDHPSGHLGGWARLWSAEEMLDGQRQRVNIPVHAKTAHKGLLQKKNSKKISAESSLTSPRRANRSRDWTELMFATDYIFRHKVVCLKL